MFRAMSLRIASLHPAVRVAAVAVLASLAALVPTVASADTLYDDFNRADSTGLGSGWTESGTSLEISGNQLIQTGGISYALSASQSRSATVDVSLSGPSGFVGIVIGGDTGSMNTNAMVKIQDNASSGTFTNVYFYSGSNGGSISGTPNIVNLATPVAAARFTVTVDDATVTAEVDSDFDGTPEETFVSTYSSTIASGYAGLSLWSRGIADNFRVGGEASTITADADPASTAYGAGSLGFTVDAGAVTPTGDVELDLGGGTVLTETLSSGVASFALDGLDAGAYSYTATYVGDANVESSVTTGSLTVSPAATATVLAASSTSPAAGTDVLLTATVTSTPDAVGDVTFYDGTEVLGTVPVAAGAASFTVTGIAAGDHAYRAEFVGTNFATSEDTVDVAAAVVPVVEEAAPELPETGAESGALVAAAAALVSLGVVALLRRRGMAR